MRGSFLYSSAVEKRSQVSCVDHVAHACTICADAFVLLITPSTSDALPRSWSPSIAIKTGRIKRTGSKSGGERVDAVCDDQTCDRNRFSSPFSLKEVYPPRARSRFSSGRVGGVLGYRTGGVERPHGLDCN